MQCLILWILLFVRSNDAQFLPVNKMGDLSVTITNAPNDDAPKTVSPVGVALTKTPTTPITNTPMTTTTTKATAKPVTTKPTKRRTNAPTKAPTKRRTMAPTKRRTMAPTKRRTMAPTNAPTTRPTKTPTNAPTQRPTLAPTQRPTKAPTNAPTQRPTMAPTNAPTKRPTMTPANAPTKPPTMAPTNPPTKRPTKSPTKRPTKRPTMTPTKAPLTLLTPRFILDFPSPFELHPVRFTPICIALEKRSFTNERSNVILRLNNVTITIDRLMSFQVCSRFGLLVDGANTIDLVAKDSGNNPMSFSQRVWAGSNSMTVRLLLVEKPTGPGGTMQVPSGPHVIVADLFPGSFVRVTKSTTSNSVVFTNLPSGQVVSFRVDGGSSTSVTIGGGTNEITLTK